MKKVMLALSAMLLLANTNFAKATGQKNVPEKVVQAFSAKYQGDQVKKWKTDKDTDIAKIVVDKRKTYAEFLSDGTWLKTETKLPWSWDLPNAVYNTWKKCEYRSWYVEEIMKVESPDNGTYYTIKVDYEYGPEGAIPGDWMKVNMLYFDESGNLTKVEHIRD